MNYQELPPDPRQHLNRVIEHHRDVDEPPIHFRFAYILRASSWAPKQADYDSAIEALAACIKAIPLDERQHLEASVLRFNSEDYLSGPAGDALQQLGYFERLAHAWAGAYIFSAYFDLERYLDPGIPAASRVLTVYPELARLFTPKDSLLRVGDRVTPGHAWVTYKQHEIHPHPCLRRGFGSRVHYELLDKLWSQHASGLDVSIAIDHFRLCPRGQLGRFHELDAWFGAPFSLQKVDDQYAVGATLHARVKDISPFDRAGLLTEFRWSYADGLKTFELEELPAPTDSRRPVICRYAHAIRNIMTKKFVHLDGAVTIYDRATYKNRYEQATDHKKAKVWAPRKVKLFRIDDLRQEGQKGIPDDQWTSIIVSFLRNNELVLEYFDGRPFDEIYRSRYGHDHPWLGAPAGGTS